MTKMVVLSPFSGSSLATMNRLNHLVNGMDAKFVLPKQDKYGISPENSKFYFPVERKSFLSLPLYISKAVLYLHSQKPDVIYSYKAHPFTFPIAFIHRIFHPCTLISDCDEWESATMKDNGEPYYKRLFMDVLSNFAIQYSNKVIYTNEYILKEKIPKKYWGKCIYIPNGVDTKEFKPKKHRKNKHFTIMFVGTLHKTKHIVKLFDAVGEASEKIPNIRCIIIGDGPKRKELEKEAYRGDSWDKLYKFYGKISQKRLLELLPTADALVLPFPDLEGLHYQSNIKLFEYMAMEVPIIASDVGELKKHLDGGKAGYIVKPDSPKAIANAIIKIYSKPKEAMRKAKRARELAVKKNDWKFKAKTLGGIINENQN